MGSSAHEQWMAALSQVHELPDRCTILRDELRRRLTLINELLLHEDATPKDKLEACRLIREVRQEARAASPVLASAGKEGTP